ncbi:MAG: hypothetical protein ACE5NC_08640 [Anaerolineae bacterium]
MKSAAVIVMAIVLGTGVCQAEDSGYSGLEWEAGRGWRERPAVSRHIYNRSDQWATDIQLLVEELDTTGRVVGKTIGYVDRSVPVGDRTHFEVRVPTAVAMYRVTVHSFNVFHGPSGP